jgi:molecular chaperone GrpE (heat shock protein)
MSGDSTQQQTQQQNVPLLGDNTDELRTRWETIQNSFVDEPQQSVEQADALVTEVIKRLTKTFQETRDSLETQLGEAEEVSTEDLRIGLQRYRSFFERLLAA